MRHQIVVFLLLSAAGLLAAEGEPKPTYWWNVNAATSKDGWITVPDKITGAAFSVEANSGVTLAESSDGSGGKSLAFDGTQPKAVVSVAKINADANMSVSFKLNIADTGHVGQTVLQMPGLQIYAASEGPLHFGAGGTELVLPAPRGTMVTVTATIKGSDLEFQVDDKSVSGALPEGKLFEPEPGVLSIGGFKDNGALVGEISDIKISPASK